MFSNPRQVAPPGIEPGTYSTISESLHQCATLPPIIITIIIITIISIIVSPERDYVINDSVRSM